VAGLLVVAPLLGAAAEPAAAQGAGGAAGDAAFARWDADHDGVLSRAEFRAGWDVVQRARVQSRLHAQFARLDRDRSGALDAGEYAQVVLAQRAGAGGAMSRFDLDHDGRIDITDSLRSVQAPAPVASEGGARGR